ncbi:pyridoxal-phosphate dependent enzyme [Phytomonospora sp. NPDC050363]|uniref:1-aminocyclopropane-1-carboxylate deaminase/D-cysteine desulfhydrase n=1 Tax=Phytomonospora sp. NPDC050363 TaxID=3155642 RepID=UPI0033FD56CC
MPEPLLPSPLTELRDPRLSAKGTRLWLKRDDLVHPFLPGNKWRKLRLNLDEALAAGHRALLTFGGAYSNHLRAVAAAGRLHRLRTIGVVRGEERLPLNPSLSYAVGQGMTLDYLDRAAYRRKRTPPVLDALRERWGEVFVIPEGGANAAGVRGCAEVTAELDVQLPGGYDHVVTAVGTGATLAGLAHGLTAGRSAVGVCVLKGAQDLIADVERLQVEAFGRACGDWTLDHRFHHGGFARSTPQLREFVAGFAERHGVELEPVYVAKALHAILEGGLGAGRRLVFLVTGPPM